MTRMISVRDEVYDVLSMLKNRGESFSDLFLRLTSREKKQSVMDFAGAWADWDEADEIFAKILARRSLKRRKVTL